jgi:hypothetical protein
MASLALSSSDSRPDCSWHKVNSAEFMRLTQAKDQITQITEAILNRRARCDSQPQGQRESGEGSVEKQAQDVGGAEGGEQTVSWEDLLAKMEPHTSKPPSRTLLPSPNRVL